MISPVLGCNDSVLGRDLGGASGGVISVVLQVTRSWQCWGATSQGLDVLSLLVVSLSLLFSFSWGGNHLKVK